MAPDDACSRTRNRCGTRLPRRRRARHRCHAMSLIRLGAAALLLCMVSGCALRARSTVVDGAPAPQMSELWTEPDAGRDLFWGPGGIETAPDPHAEYRFVARDVTGKSPGYDVRDAQGRLWSVKLGPEAQSGSRRVATALGRRVFPAGHLLPSGLDARRGIRSQSTAARPVPSGGRGRDQKSTTGRGAVIRSSAPRRCAASLC